MNKKHLSMESKRKTNNYYKNRFIYLFVLLFSVAAFSCNDDETETIDDNTEEGGDLYAIFYRVSTPDGRLHYTTLINDLMTGSIDPSNAIETSGNARFFAPDSEEYFTIADPADYSFTRYNITEDNKIWEGEKFSMANEGVTDLQNRNIFLSQTKAYYIDYTQGQIIVWNPETMAITKSFNLPEQLRDGYQGNWVTMPFYDFQIVGNRLYIPAGWMNWENETYVDRTGLAIVDIENDAVISYSEDDRCPLAVMPAIMENGDAYYGTSYYLPYATTSRQKEDCGCILKVEAGADGFDQDYDPYYMDQIEGYRVGISLGKSPKENHGYVRVLDTEKLAWSPEMDGSDYYSLSWMTYEINLPEQTVVGKTNLPYAGSYVGSPYYIDGKNYGSISDEDGNSTIIRFAPDGSYTEGITLPGSLMGIQKVR
ncbi:hypothetical protein [Echinicola sp. 20G]|uniref:hypothetical protein n=1 Tax=Echinicola sp. 20G TaxID=2781961 RepID=UPI001910C4A9|nr:hypothetical protein [Echinicola sp. 20G]